MDKQPSKAQISRAAIQRMHVEMRHLLIRGSFKPCGRSGQALVESLLSINPEIYGSIADPERVELNGLLYVCQRLPIGLEQCRYIKLISREGYERSEFEPIIPSKRRRNCYRIDDEQMYIEMTRGRSDVYDILTHLTFMYHEAQKIGANALNGRNQPGRDWLMLKSIVEKKEKGEEFDSQVAISYLSSLLGRTFDETSTACDRFDKSKDVNDLFSICYWMGKRSIEETLDRDDREISFSSALREKLGHHIFGERWANQIKSFLMKKGMFHRPIHIISANMHSVMNTLYAVPAIKGKATKSLFDLAEELSTESHAALRKKVKDFATKNGLTEIDDKSGTNIPIQIIDLKQIEQSSLPPELAKLKIPTEHVLLVMDYAFGEQAYETMDELLKPYDHNGSKEHLQVKSVNIMGKAGILQGGKGDIMVATAHVFEGTADNYPLDNELKAKDFKSYGLGVYEGTMITVLGTSLQNRDVLRYFLKSSWKAVGLEMEGAHYQKAIQVASKIRNSISPEVKLRYAYYASDNPLETGATLASGSLGLEGVKPTYAITTEILKGIFS